MSKPPSYYICGQANAPQTLSKFRDLLISVMWWRLWWPWQPDDRLRVDQQQKVLIR